MMITQDPKTKTIVLIGLMGAGKSSIGRRLAKALSLPFYDADDEIVSKINCSIPEIFKKYGEPEFRKIEQQEINRLLKGPQHVLATGGGAFINEKIQTIIKQKGISIWLSASLDVLLERTSKRGGRPLLEGCNPREILSSLIKRRYPIYSKADLIIETGRQSHQDTVDQIKKKYLQMLASIS